MLLCVLLQKYCILPRNVAFGNISTVLHSVKLLLLLFARECNSFVSANALNCNFPPPITVSLWRLPNNLVENG